VTVVQYGIREPITFVKKQLVKKEVVTEILDVVNHFSLKSYKVAKARSAFVLRWRREREPSLERTSLNFSSQLTEMFCFLYPTFASILSIYHRQNYVKFN